MHDPCAEWAQVLMLLGLLLTDSQPAMLQQCQAMMLWQRVGAAEPEPKNEGDIWHTDCRLSKLKP